MLEINNFTLNNIVLNLDIEKNSKIAFYGKKDIINLLLLSLSGITKNLDTIKYNNHDIYDYQEYFNTRIYLDSKVNYFQTIIGKKIANIVKVKFNKNVDEEALTKHINKLCIRGECEITDKYVLTPTGNSLLNLSFALSCKHDLILENPFLNIDKISDVEYFSKEIINFKNGIIFGLDRIKPLIKTVQKIYIIGDNDIHEVDLKNDKLFIIDKVESIVHFLKFNDKYLLINPNKDDIKKCTNSKNKLVKITYEELDKYMGELWEKRLYY